MAIILHRYATKYFENTAHQTTEYSKFAYESKVGRSTSMVEWLHDR